jgi:hypothetical protein
MSGSVLDTTTIVDFSKQVLPQVSRLRARIAAVARANDAVIVTDNVRVFPQVDVQTFSLRGTRA